MYSGVFHGNHYRIPFHSLEVLSIPTAGPMADMCQGARSYNSNSVYLSIYLVYIHMKRVVKTRHLNFREILLYPPLPFYVLPFHRKEYRLEASLIPSCSFLYPFCDLLEIKW